MDDGFTTIGIVGTGAMGAGIAQIAAQAGARVLLHDSRPDAAAAAQTRLAGIWRGLVDKGRMTAAEAAVAGARLAVVPALAGLAGCDLVVEAIVEDLDAKRALFAALESAVGPACVLATNTSSLSVTAIAAACRAPGRVGGFHFFNPVPLMRIVEVVAGARSEPAILDRLERLATRMGHRAVRCIDAPGFVVNHAGRGYGTEALQMAFAESIAAPVDIDRALRDQVGFRMGPFELMDLVGLDVVQPVMESLHAQFHGEPRFRPSWVLRQRVAAGLLGRKSGAGFYAYDGDRARVPGEPAAPPARPRPVWIAAEREAWRTALAGIVAAAGWPLDDGARPRADSLALLAPLSRDATSEAAAHELDPARAVAVDALFGLERRRVMMGTVATAADALDAAHALLAADGATVTRLRDSAGFVAPRTVAMIVNVACDIAQQRIAAPADIDEAVRVGLGYPGGPLTLGDRLGGSTVLAILDGLFAASRDPRYRPSPWLRRRAALGLSLLAPET